MVKKEPLIKLVTYADANMTKSMEVCYSSAMKHGVDVVWPQNPGTISHEFNHFNRGILSQERGAGYWLWKPYIVYRAMLSCEEGDTLIYSDAGIEFVNSVKEITCRMDEDIFFFTNGFPHVEWCKGDVLASILPITNHDVYGYPHIGHDEKQVQASVIFFMVNQKTIDFVKEWLLYCQMPGFIDDSPSKLPNYPTFAEHRHDQAILTCLQIKYGYRLHFWPTRYSEHIRYLAQEVDNYPTIFNHHRRRDPGKGNGETEW